MVEEIRGDEKEGEDKDASICSVISPEQRRLEGLPDLLRLCPWLPRAVRVLHVGDEEDVDWDQQGGHEGQSESKHRNCRTARGFILWP